MEPCGAICGRPQVGDVDAVGRDGHQRAVPREDASTQGRPQLR